MLLAKIFIQHAKCYVHIHHYELFFVTSQRMGKKGTEELVAERKEWENKRPMGHNALTCMFANAMQQSSSIATATGT